MKHILLNLLRVLPVLLLLGACDTITEEMEPCKNYVSFRYDRNMKFVDAFPVEVRRVNLYVFDADDRLVATLSDEREAFGDGYRMELPLPAGDYRLIAWAGLYDRSYEFASNLTVGVSTPEDLRVKMRRGADNVQDNELDALWHGEIPFTVTDGESRTVTLPLTKDTNKFRIVVQGAEMALDKDDLDFTITDDNGYLDSDNTLLPDEAITYRPYYRANADLSDSGDGQVSAVVAEMNTLRLIDGKKPRLRVTHRNGKELVNIDLITYLLLTKMEGHDMPPQEYLDRQDEYALIFFLNRDALGNYLLMYVKVNGWTIRPQEGEFGF